MAHNAAMTFSLGSLQSGDDSGFPPDAAEPAAAKAKPAVRSTRASKSRPAPPVLPQALAPETPSVRMQLGLVLGGVLWLLLFLALATHRASDPGFSTSGDGSALRNSVGVIGAWVSDLAYFLLGYSVWWLLAASLQRWLKACARVLRAHAGLPPLQAGRSAWWFWLGLPLLMCASTALEWSRVYLWEAGLPGGHAGGVLGYTLGAHGQNLLGFAGSGVCWIVVAVLALSATFGFSWMSVAERLGEWVERLMARRSVQRELAEDARLGEKALRERERERVVEAERPRLEEPLPLVIEPPVVAVPQSDRVVKEAQQMLFSELENKLPQVDLLDAAPARMETISPETLEMTSRLIEKKLKDFGVEVRVVQASPGPVITRYEIEPATGVKGSQVVNLAKDLARSLSLVSIRVVETIPGKTTMALELPNPKRQTIRLAEILGSQVYHDAASLLTMGLGKDIVGNPVVADLAKMPHCLVAGTTGSGKSVGINAMILSLLYKADARDVRLILIDPKMLEMSVYEGIPHLLCPVVTDMKQAANALNWGVGEMERRYKLMSKMGVRNLSSYNKKMDEAAARGEHIPNPFSLTPEAPEPLERLPYVVIVIDELADLMMVVGKKIEELIARLAQKARASGIHLILATQRPSVDVITGLIKANIPTRLSFQVSSKIDSRTILDQMGAEALLGMGDMLYMASGTGLPVRVHGAFVSDDEVHRVVNYLKEQGEPNYIEGILEGGTLDGEGGEGGADGPVGGGGGENDPMYDQAVAVVLQHKRASISLVQRHLRIGYNRAARLLEQMEKSGLVSAMGHSGNRDIIAPRNTE
jgi:S-DNA-T family DNA segregation ATPase FtsK/SpoIIIE